MKGVPKMKAKKTIVALILTFCLTIAFSGTGFAEEVKYIDADTALKEYTELYAKYYPDEVTVSVEKYVPIESGKFYEELNLLEEQLEKSVLPENNIKVEYNEDNEIIGITYPLKYSKEAQKYVLKYEKQIAARSQAQVQNIEGVTPLATRTTKDVTTFRRAEVVGIPWTPAPTFYAGYYCTFHLASQADHVPTKWFTSVATGFKKYIYYIGSGSGSVTLETRSQQLLDNSSTNKVDQIYTVKASVVNQGVTLTFERTLRNIYEWRANTVWSLTGTE